MNVIVPEKVVPTDFVRDAGITFRQLDTWTKAGHLHPLGSPSPGSGHQREYLFEELVIARCIKDLLDAGLTLPTAADLARRGPGEYDLSARVHVRVAPQSRDQRPFGSESVGR